MELYQEIWLSIIIVTCIKFITNLISRKKLNTIFFSALKFNCRYYQTIHKKKVMCFINSFKPTHWLIKYNQTLINLPIAITEL